MKWLLLLSFLLGGFSSFSLGEIRLTRIDKQGNEIKFYSGSYALVIGISQYSKGWKDLEGVAQEVRDVSYALKRHGFRVTQVLNPSGKEMDQAMKKFLFDYGFNPDNRLLFFFAGHGHTLVKSYGEKMGYIVPSDAPNPKEDRKGFLSRGINLEQMELYARNIEARHALFLFDSCFSGSLLENMPTRSVSPYISEKVFQPVRQFITAGKAGEDVPDQSIFGAQLIRALQGEGDIDKDGYITGTELGEFLTKKVTNYSKGTQHPQYGKIRNRNLDKGDFIFQVPKEKRKNSSPVNPLIYYQDFTSNPDFQSTDVNNVFWDFEKSIYFVRVLGTGEGVRKYTGNSPVFPHVISPETESFTVEFDFNLLSINQGVYPSFYFVDSQMFQSQSSTIEGQSFRFCLCREDRWGKNIKLRLDSTHITTKEIHRNTWYQVAISYNSQTQKASWKIVDQTAKTIFHQEKNLTAENLKPFDQLIIGDWQHPPKNGNASEMLVDNIRVHLDSAQ